jgi:hypothetical protein
LNETENVLENSKRLLELYKLNKQRKEGERLLKILPQGEGSGLDADLLDGKHAQEIVKEAVEESAKIPVKVPAMGGGGVDVSEFKPHPIDSATYHSGSITDAQHGVRTLANAHALTDLSGIITATQHGSLTSIPDAHHRKWSWADEQGGKHCYSLPFCDQYKMPLPTLMLDVGATGKFDDVHVGHPCMVGFEDYVYMFYHANDGTNWRIGVARTSTSTPLSGYTRLNDGDPIIEPDYPTYVNYHVSPMYDEWETNSDKRWKAFWTHRISGTYEPYYGYNSGPDTPFTISGAVTGLTNFRWWAGVQRLGRLYYGCYVDSGYQFRLAVADDPTSWTDLGILLQKGSAGQWDDYYIGEGSIYIHIGATNYLLYYGSTSGGLTRAFGLAYNWDPVGLPFTKYTRNPLTPQFSSGSPWNSFTASDGGSLIMVGEKMYFFMSGKTDKYRNYGCAIF